MASISVLIITLNEEKNIRRCLESVKWVDEIVVVDSESSDQTVEITKEYTEKVYIRKWEGFAAAKNYALQHIHCEWIFWLDADEEATPELHNEIVNSLKTSDIEGYLIPRKANFLGKWIKHSGWYPGYVLRLIKKDLANFHDKKVHEFLEIPEKIEKLNSPILHYTDPNITHYIKKLNRYTSLASEELFNQEKHFRLIDLLIRPLHLTLKMYILKFGFLDGFQGFVLALCSGFYVFVKYAKLWELQRQNLNEK